MLVFSGRAEARVTQKNQVQKAKIPKKKPKKTHVFLRTFCTRVLVIPLPRYSTWSTSNHLVPGPNIAPRLISLAASLLRVICNITFLYVYYYLVLLVFEAFNQLLRITHAAKSALLTIRLAGKRAENWYFWYFFLVFLPLSNPKNTKKFFWVALNASR